MAIASPSAPPRCPSPTGPGWPPPSTCRSSRSGRAATSCPRTGTGEAITRLALLTAWTERVRVGTAVLAAAAVPAGGRGQAARRPRRPVRRAGVGRRRRRRRVPRTSSTPSACRVAERGARTDEAMRRPAGAVVGRAGHPPRPVLRPRRRRAAPGARPRAATRRPMQPGGPPLVVSGRKDAGHAPGRPAGRRLDAVPGLARGLRPLGATPIAGRGGRARRPRPRPGFEWMLYLYCSVRADGDRARDDVAAVPRRAYGDKPPAMLDRIAPAGTPDEVAAAVPGVRRRRRPPLRRSRPPRTRTRSRSCARRRGGPAPADAAGRPGVSRDPADAAGRVLRPASPSSRSPSGSATSGSAWPAACPGMLLADLGATVTRVVGPAPPAIDADVPWGRAWHRGKQVVATDDAAEDRATLLRAPTSRSSTAPRRWSRAAASAAHDLRGGHPGLVYARCRPSRTADRRGRRLRPARRGPGRVLHPARRPPARADLRRRAGAGRRRRASCSPPRRWRCCAAGRSPAPGGWAETSLYDGMLATLGCMIGRSERAAPEIESYWAKGSSFPNFLYRCADGELVQIWFGGKGMYAKLIEVLGDEPSDEGYYADQMNGPLQRPGGAVAGRLRHPAPGRCGSSGSGRPASRASRCSAPARRWPTPTWPRSAWPCARSDGGHDDVRASPRRSSVAPAGRRRRRRRRRRPTPMPRRTERRRRRLLDGRAGASTSRRSWPGRSPPRCWPTSAPRSSRSSRPRARRCGPPPTPSPPASGASAAWPSTSARPRPARSSSALLRWADVVLHNFRVGVSERLGIDEATVAAPQPRRRLLPRQRLRPDGPAGQGPRATTRSCRRSPASSGPSAARATTRSRPRGSRSTWSAAGWPPPASSPGSTPGPTSGRGPAGGDEPAGRRDAAAQRRLPARRRGGARARARRRPDRLRPRLPPLRGRRRRRGWRWWCPTPRPGRGCARAGGRRRCRRPTRRCAAGPTTPRPGPAEAVLEAAFATAPRGRLGRPPAGRRACWPSWSSRSTATGSAGASSTTRSTGSSAGSSPTRRPTGAASSRSARCCAAGPTPAAARR